MKGTSLLTYLGTILVAKTLACATLPKTIVYDALDLAIMAAGYEQKNMIVDNLPGGYSASYQGLKTNLLPLASILDGDVTVIVDNNGSCIKSSAAPGYRFPSSNSLNLVLKKADTDHNRLITTLEAKNLESEFCTALKEWVNKEYQRLKEMQRHKRFGNVYI